MMEKYYIIIAKELGIEKYQVENTAYLLSQGATIPFIARYRKELTGSLDEVVIAKIRDRIEQLTELDKRRGSILQIIEELGKLTPELKLKIDNASTMAELEDLYLPYKPKKKTRATIAIAKGLEPLAKTIFEQGNVDLESEAEKYLNSELDVNTASEALQGANDIIAEWINENEKARNVIRQYFKREAVLKSKVVKKKIDEAQKYTDYFQYEETLSKAPSHRVLAILRGENEGSLSVSIVIDEETALNALQKLFIKANNQSAKHVSLAIKDGYKRLMQASMETEFRNLAKEKADAEAIHVFSENIRQLLLSPPLGQKNILAIDPGFRTGCKIVCLDKTGNLLHNTTIYPHPPENKVRESVEIIASLTKKYNIEAIAIGNGTAGRETERFVKSIDLGSDIAVVNVNESGASVYSASDVARQEFPDYDVTVRGAVSIGRRLMDPLAELVKIDPKSIGVGQYQHDVNQNALQKSLDETVMSCVNAVGVDINTASPHLLRYVSGLGNVLAKSIVEYRTTNGPFKSRKEFKKVSRFGDKVFEQAAGFLRIQNAKHPLDSSAVHPESYHIVEKMAEDMQCEITDLIKSNEIRKKINLKNYINSTIGLPTLEDIMSELAKPGRDPRQEFEIFEFDNNVHEIQDLKLGMVLPGIITNITKFGAFVDIGVHQDGLVHISNLANKYVKDPADIVHLQQKVRVKVIEVDSARKRISLSMKDLD